MKSNDNDNEKNENIMIIMIMININNGWNNEMKIIIMKKIMIK